MSITTDQATEIQNLAVDLAIKSLDAGFHCHSSPEAWESAQDEAAKAHQAFSDALWALAEGKDSPQLEEGSGGVKSIPADLVVVAAKIDHGGSLPHIGGIHE